MAARRLSVRTESWPLNEPFVISRMSQEAAEVVVVEIAEAGMTGRGECERGEWFDETLEPVAETIERVRGPIEAGAGRERLLTLLPAGNARNALDCALWDLEAKRSGTPAWRLAGLERAPGPVATVFTISLGTPQAMARAAAARQDHGSLKLKLGATGETSGDIERLELVRAAAPDTRLTVDANMGWDALALQELLPVMAELGISLVEQPLPVGEDAILAEIDRLVPIAADESCLDRHSLPHCVDRYDVVNIKLDKAGGLTEALALKAAAEAQGFGVMVGCNVGTSLAMAPSVLLAQGTIVVDLDGPLLLSEDRAPGLRYEGDQVFPSDPELWG